MDMAGCPAESGFEVSTARLLCTFDILKFAISLIVRLRTIFLQPQRRFVGLRPSIK